MAHNCSNLLIRCMDYRLDITFKKWLAENNYLGDTDIVSIAGACKPLAGDDKKISDYILNQIAISTKLHHIKRVLLTQHEECGAYGETSRDIVLKDMEKAKSLISAQYPDLTILLFWVKKIGDNWELEEIK
ncbi:MAG: carbonic anhydrase [Patescibacteria group bacterium]